MTVKADLILIGDAFDLNVFGIKMFYNNSFAGQYGRKKLTEKEIEVILNEDKSI